MSHAWKKSERTLCLHRGTGDFLTRYGECRERDGVKRNRAGMAERNCIMESCKIYVDVNATFTKDGRLLPRSFIWTDGH